MSSHGTGYRIYADDEADRSHEDWIKADMWLNGVAFSRDFNEAVSIAKMAAVNCHYPFVVMEIPTGGKRQKTNPVWVFDNR